MHAQQTPQDRRAEPVTILAPGAFAPASAMPARSACGRSCAAILARPAATAGPQSRARDDPRTPSPGARRRRHRTRRLRSQLRCDPRQNGSHRQSRQTRQPRLGRCSLRCASPWTKRPAETSADLNQTGTAPSPRAAQSEGRACYLPGGWTAAPDPRSNAAARAKQKEGRKNGRQQPPVGGSRHARCAARGSDPSAPS